MSWKRTPRTSCAPSFKRVESDLTFGSKDSAGELGLSQEGVKRCSRCRRYKPRAAFASSAAYYRKRQGARGGKPRPGVAAPGGHEYRRRRGGIKPHSERGRTRTASDGLSTACNACRAIEGRARHPQRHHGLAEAERDAMVASQKGLSVICLKAATAHVDHCHETGRVRGVPCFSCDAALGQLKDRPDAIRRAAA
ncbi:endonuclease domain-containing protein [Streptomyces sp. AC627_RSS907]|uniref:endonuclease domain-containing protein n=1 Tax=Streptomyces sp. AC627_RSS907 TaxID=2823684 RepID=UPI0027E40321|nr:endonuclease domain-containing protein [Streptomyces sp. AC627_RSS907]